MDSSVLWLVLAATVTVALVPDLFVFQRGVKEVPTRSAFLWSGAWLGLAIAFGVFVWFAMGSAAGTQYFTGYLIEKSLSVDNVAVFAILFTALAVPPALRYRALTIAVILAIVLRGLLIAVGAVLLDAFWWMPILFGVFLVVTAVRMARHTDPTEDPENSRVFKLIRRVIPVTNEFHGERLTIVEHGKRIATPLLVTLLALAAFDLIFAIDSVPAITRSPTIRTSSSPPTRSHCSACVPCTSPSRRHSNDFITCSRRSRSSSAGSA